MPHPTRNRRALTRIARLLGPDGGEVRRSAAGTDRLRDARRRARLEMRSRGRWDG
ncbi:hypothetical protein GCM10027160_49920 [Streptomyces calidiresistens]|uniref:Uncharacterized protein n=1 Tax=Streptomyces calidiresistens TaxID=1485586 RepID=A0A7W3T936_9ACTN|nr:hypothetical protein [Streptomyces calidiresistens]MBB0233164.1 hypothetical protein [Streptomyces calidiresistens]